MGKQRRDKVRKEKVMHMSSVLRSFLLSDSLYFTQKFVHSRDTLTVGAVTIADK